MPHYRVTRPERYPAGCVGHLDKSARQGYYTDAKDENEADRIIRARLAKNTDIVFNQDERLDIQFWRP